MNLKSKIGLGTVQFGTSYGISNTQGQTSPEEVTEILDYARKEGIDLLDTAAAYGISEEILGNNNLTGFNIVSKFMAPENNQKISKQLESSLDLLKISSLYGYMAHRPQDVLLHSHQWEELRDLKRNNLIQKIGFSFNEPYEIDEVLLKGWIPDIVQVPFNYFDNRFSQQLVRLKSTGCEVHTRSAFLQGLFFMQPDSLPQYFDIVKPSIKDLQKNGEKLAGMLLKYCLQQDFIDKVIVGVNNKNQLISNLNFTNSEESLPEFSLKIPNKILMPSKWKI